ncbi:MAG: stalk domain-containing protein [Bacillota bacterium]
MKKKRVALAICALFMLGGTAVYAASPQIKGTIQNFKYLLNGKSWNQSDKPILVNGQYYLPVSVVKEATKTNVTIDKAKGTVHIGENLKETPILSNQVTYYNAFLTRDKTYTSNFKEVVITKGSLPSVYLYPEAKYQTLVLDIMAIEEDAIVVINNQDKSEEMKSLLIPKDSKEQIEINITGIKRLDVAIKGKVVVYPTSHYK